jgi:tetratricopeptide (TPR) repeat protein
LTVTATVIAAVVAGSAPLLPVQAAVDQRELRAREAYAVGRYQEALDLFGKLYAETLHPNYLRNIGRCYQNLGDPDRAVISFRDYLRKSKTLSADERIEIDGYIKEMEDLKAKRESAKAAEAANASDKPPVAPAAATVVPAASAPASPSSGTPGTDLTARPGSRPPADEAQPLYTRWWFWTAIGGAAALTLGIAAGAGAFTKTVDAKCPPPYKC